MGNPQWTLVGFPERLVEWIGREHPPQWLEARVANWLPTLALDPFHHAEPEPAGGGDLFAVEIPDAAEEGWQVVCSFLIEREAWVVRCVQIEFRDDQRQSGH